MASLDEFREWLRTRGRAESTQDVYVRILERLFEHEDPKEPILDSSYSPLYRRSMAACLKQWAIYTKDPELLESLDKRVLKLPAALLQNPRKPLPRDEWFSILEYVEDGPLLEPVRSVCGLIVMRGLRCGDALRLTKSEITQALKTGLLAFEGKGGRRLEYSARPLRPFLRALEGRFFDPQDHLWNLVCPRAAKPERAATRKIRRAMDKMATELGYEPEEIFSHRFRHTYATEFLTELKGDPRAVFLLQDQMGWASFNTARSYIARGEQKELDAIESKIFKGRKS